MNEHSFSLTNANSMKCEAHPCHKNEAK